MIFGNLWKEIFSLRREIDRLDNALSRQKEEILKLHCKVGDHSYSELFLWNGVPSLRCPTCYERKVPK